MRIIVVDWENNKEEIETNENELIKDIIEKLGVKIKNKRSIILSYNGEILEKNEKVSSYDIDDNSIIFCTSIFKNKRINIFIVDSENHREKIEIYENEFIKDIIEKLIVKEIINNNNNKVILLYDGEILDENKKVSSYYIHNNDEIVFAGNFINLF